MTKTAVDVLGQMRDHVERNGITGGNSIYAPDVRTCPRGMVTAFTGQIWTEPNELGREVLALLDTASTARPSYWDQPIGTGRKAEVEANRIEGVSGDQSEAVEFIDRALALA